MNKLAKLFFHAFPNLKGNRAVEAFIRKPEYQEAIEQYLNDPVEENRLVLDECFKDFYFGVRFTSYVSTSLYFQSVNFDKRSRRFEERNALTLDQPVGDEEGVTLKDQIIEGEEDTKREPLEASIENQRLLDAFLSLTVQQRKILNLAYVEQYTDTEIAASLGVSQQSVSKSHKRALDKLKEQWTEGV
ncbi:sigma-70 family RNA polymerase sigma factor [Halobacillus litoralis]|uniref:sigma-70 family RNA polymerase sigma factor n=1 Tax=Halobacillus litoralis TaxID=45668 RepID=UPI001CD19789|nr:sigma-70 family RNA polymerase sigma factor [Halobacillus litoralis]MCA0972381.1 sigma-70 family RNA polymerase sigma factor [Halobacillus litoralis]